MPWYVFAIASAAFTSVNSLIEKRVLRKAGTLELSSAIALVGLLATLPLAFFVPWTGINIGTLLFIFFGTLLGALAYLLAM